jgi:hypothetical protein
MVLLTLVAALVLAGTTLAMRSATYWLDWFTPLTGGGGGLASSTNYAVHFTVGQVAIGSTTSSSYQTCLGYWCGAVGLWHIYLPAVLK